MNKPKYCFLGDSITEGVGVQKGERYCDIIGNVLNVEAVSYGVNGAQSVNLPEQIQQMWQQNGSVVDVIFVFIGTNDFNSGVPLGSFFEEYTIDFPTLYDDNDNTIETTQRKKRCFSYDATTFCGRLNVAFTQLRNLYPTTPIVLLTPLHRAYACFSTTNIQADELTANGIDLYLESYVDVIRKCADIWSLQLIDLYRESGLFPLNDENAQVFFCSDKTDRLHPNAQGHKRIAQTIIIRFPVCNII